MFTRKSAASARSPHRAARPCRALLARRGRAGGGRSQAGKGPRPTIVLVHGDWADGSSWTSVIKRLQRKGFTVVAPPNLLRGPATDAPYLASYLKSIPGPIVLVAHSYGGFVATNAATGNDNVKALVYIDAFAPDEGETAGELVERGHSCVDENALNPVPYDGGVDLYLRWEANAALPGLHRVLRQRRRSQGGRRSCRRAAARGTRAVHRALRASGVEDDPVLVTHRDVGQRDPARAAGGDVQPGRRSHLQGQGRPPDAHHTSC